MTDSYVDILLFPGDLGSAIDQNLGLVDNPADIVRDSSCSIRGARAALENNDIKLGASPASLRGGAHPCSIPSDYNQPFPHGYSPPSGIVPCGRSKV